MEFVQNSQVSYVELEENDVNRRYILPNFENLEGKIRGALQGNPKVLLIRTGNATITSKTTDDIATVTGLQAIPSSVDAVYNIEVHDHPVLGHSGTTARYSNDLTGLISATEPTREVVTVSQVNAPPAEPKKDLTSQLRQQMLGGKLQEKTEKPQANIEVVKQEQTELVKEESTMKMEDFIAQKKAEQPSKAEINKALKPRPVGKIDVLIEEMEDLREEVSDLRNLIIEMKSGLGV